MISRSDVIAQRLSALRDATDDTVHLVKATGTAPALGVYHVLELPDGPLADGDGDLVDPNRHPMIRFRLRTVASSTSPEASALAATAAASTLGAVMVDRTDASGDGWVMAGCTMASTSGAMAEGALVNVVDDYEALIVPGPAAEPVP